MVLLNKKNAQLWICFVLVTCLLLGLIPFGAQAATQEVSITGISNYNFRGNDWFIILDVDQADFALTGVAGLKAPMDNTTSQIWFQSNSAMGVDAGKVSFTLAADKAEHTVTLPAGTVLGQYVLKEDFVFCTHADGNITMGEAVEPPVEDASTFQIAGIVAYNYRSNSSDWYLVLQTNQPDFRLDAVASLRTLGVTSDGAAVGGWFQATKDNPGQLEFNVSVDKNEHTVVLPAGLELGGYTLAKDFVFCTHADGSVTVAEMEEPPVEDVSTFQITGVVAYNYRSGNGDWYLILQTNRPDFRLDAVASLRKLGVTSDGAAVGGWFQINTDNPGQLEFDVDIDKNEHTVMLPAGLELGGYTLEQDFVFFTHANGRVTVEETPEITDPTDPPTTDATEPPITEPIDCEFSITGIASGVYRNNNNDWYIILNANNSSFELEAPTGWVAPLTEGGAQVWFQSNAAMGQSGGKLIFTLAADKDEHSVTIPAGLALGNYTLKEDFTFYTHRSGVVDTVRPTVLKGWSMTLGDKLGVNFSVSVAEADLADVCVQISVGDETKLLYPETLDYETGNYIFSVELAAAQMTETVNFTLLVGDSVIETNTYTVRQYASYILNNDQFDETTKNLVRSMLVYGAKAQTYFVCNTDNYADVDIEYGQAAVPAEIASPILTGAVDGIQYYGSSMLFTSKHAVRYYFTLSEGANIADYTFTAGEEVLTAKAKDGMYFVDVGQINPQDLDNPIEVTVTCGESVLTVVYSPMHYIVRKFNSDTGSELKVLLQAMYTYHLAAEDYVAAAFKPTSLTIALYDSQESVYGFTFNTNKKPLNTVVQIQKVGTEEWIEYPVSSVSATTYNNNDTVLNYYISKTEVQLEKDSSYIYRVYDKEAEVGTEYTTLTTKDPQTDSFTFVHVSDSQEGSTYFNRVLSQVSDNADFILHTGDVVQNSKYEHEWTEMLDENFEYLSRIPVMAISGNHETTYNTRGIAETFKHFNNCLPVQASTNLGYFYSFIYGNVKFIMLNTNDLTQNKLKAEQYNWLVNELETNTCKWTVVALHNPLYSAGRYGSDSSKNEIALALQQQLQGLFAQYGVDIVLQGHDHIISKTYPIDGNGVAQSESIENVGGVEYSIDPSGVIYLMNGPAGSQTRAPYVVNDARYTYAEGSKAASWAELSFEGDILTVTVKYHDGTDEKVYYTWGIKKGSTDIPALRISSTYPYADFVKAYLEAEDPNVSDYIRGSVNPNKDTIISWNSCSQATGYTVFLSTEKDYSNAKTYQVSAENCSVAVNNLLKAQTYYVKVTAEGTSMATEASFTTTDLGPRVMTVDGVYNVRDMGGYVTASGKTTQQGLIYRGGALSPSADFPDVQITEAGIATMAEEMGIRTEIDFRNSSEALGITESLIPNAELIYCTLGGYDSGMINYAESYKKAFQLLARPENYPVYYHCTGGADRTGTVSYLLGALLGMNETDLIRDYEFTSFSIYGERNSKTTKYAFGAFCELLNTYAGTTLADKAEQYLLSIGVTEDEIFNIRAIMFGEEPKNLPEGGADIPETTVPNFFDYMNSKETITLNSDMTSVTSDLAVGYGKTVRIPLDTEIVPTGSGKMLVYIGSYGLNLRGNSLRFHINNGSDTELTPRPNSTEYKIYNNFFDDGGYMDLTVTLTDTGVIFDVVAVNSRGSSQTFGYTYENVRVANEIASSDAKIMVKIDPTQVSEVILASSTQPPATEPSTECSHEWDDATCNDPKTCTKCGATEGVNTHDMYQHKCRICGYEDELLGSFDVSSNRDGSVYAYIYKTAVDNEYALAFYGTGETKDFVTSEAPYYSLYEKIKYVEFGEGITRIGNYTLFSWNGLTIKSLRLPNTLIEIGDSAFECVNLRNAENGLQLPDSLIRIGNNAFADAVIGKLVIPDKVEYIGEEAFCGAWITNITFGAGIRQIEESAFSDADQGTILTSLEKTSYKNGYYVGDEKNPYYMLVGVSSNEITSLEIHPDTIMVYDRACMDCVFLKSVTIPDSVRIIGDCAFFCCISLTSVSFGQRVERLNGYAFYNCSNLKTISIGENLNFIGKCNFCYCYSLSEISYNGTCQKWTSIACEEGWNYIAFSFDAIEELHVGLKCSDGDDDLVLIRSSGV